jgi:hypothetical protein
MKTWVITWHHLDNSGAGVIPLSFSDVKSAEKIAALLDAYSDRKFIVCELEAL